MALTTICMILCMILAFADGVPMNYNDNTTPNAQNNKGKLSQQPVPYQQMVPNPLNDKGKSPAVPYQQTQQMVSNPLNNKDKSPAVPYQQMVLSAPNTLVPYQHQQLQQQNANPSFVPAWQLHAYPWLYSMPGLTGISHGFVHEKKATTPPIVAALPISSRHPPPVVDRRVTIASLSQRSSSQIDAASVGRAVKSEPNEEQAAALLDLFRSSANWAGGAKSNNTNTNNSRKQLP